MTAYVWRDPARHRRISQFTTEAAIAGAITSPGIACDRRQHEAVTAWQARAVLGVITEAILKGREPFAGIWDDAAAAGAEEERAYIVAVLRARAGDDLAAMVADMIGEQT